MTGATLPRTVLREQVKDVLLERILAGVYAPGDRLVETRIAQELGIPTLSEEELKAMSEP